MKIERAYVTEYGDLDAVINGGAVSLLYKPIFLNRGIAFITGDPEWIAANMQPIIVPRPDQPFHPGDERLGATKDEQVVALCIMHLQMTMEHRCDPGNVPVPDPEKAHEIVLQWMDED
jgi:hypothetical protein